MPCHAMQEVQGVQGGTRLQGAAPYSCCICAVDFLARSAPCFAACFLLDQRDRKHAPMGWVTCGVSQLRDSRSFGTCVQKDQQHE